MKLKISRGQDINVDASWLKKFNMVFSCISFSGLRILNRNSIGL